MFGMGRERFLLLRFFGVKVVVCVERVVFLLIGCKFVGVKDGEFILRDFLGL